MTGVGRDPTERGTIAGVATGVALWGGVVKGIALDRPRIALALPAAREKGMVGRWVAELVSGNASTEIVPITGGTIKVGSKVLQNAWLRSYQLSNALTLGIVGATMIYGIPNMIDGWEQADGPEGLLDSRAGRTGVMAPPVPDSAGSWRRSSTRSWRRPRRSSRACP